MDRRVTAQAIWSRLRDAPKQGARGPAVLRRLLLSSGRSVASPLERLVAGALAAPEVPPFRREHPIFADGGVYYLDFAWPCFLVGVEADSRRWHSDTTSFERDRARHNAFAAAGWHVLQVTERQVRSDPQGIRDRVRSLLVRG